MKKIYQFLLKTLTTRIIKKYNPLIIAVTGSVGKTSTKDAIFDSYSDLKNIRKSAGNFNAEIGAPLVFLKRDKPGTNLKEWILILLGGLSLLIKKDNNYPEIIVTEIAADKPGDIRYLANFIRPDIAIVTAIGDVPVHVEFYKNKEDLVREKGELVKALSKSGFAILNSDDKDVGKIETDANKITFGFSDNAMVRIKDFKLVSTKGSSLTLSYKGRDFPLFLPMCIGDSFAYIAAIVFAVGISLKIDQEKITKMVEKIRPSKGRMYPLAGIKESLILDGSYNTSPSSMKAALSALKEIEGKRKIAVIGDMLELGNFSNEEHQKIGKIAAQFCDYVISVGAWSNEIRQSVIENGVDKERAVAFKKAPAAISFLKKIIDSGDIILVKGSQGIRTEKIVVAIMQDVERADELLVRQTNFWKLKKD